MLHGDVSMQRGDSGDWSAATLNAPVVSGDKISTGNDARAEVQLDYANLLRLGPNAQANIANLTKRNIQIQLGQGIANYTVFKDGEAEPEIDTPNVSISGSDRKSTRLNSSHVSISYAVFCLKKKNIKLKHAI